MAGHLAYELAAGVGVPLASRIGVLPAAGAYLAALAAAHRVTGRVEGRPGDVVAAAANGLVLAAVLNHYTSWPRDPGRRLPWLVECEGLEGSLIVPYNVILQASAVLSSAGLAESRRAWSWGVGGAVVAYPVLRWGTPRDFEHLLRRSGDRPRWWNRRLAARDAGGFLGRTHPLQTGRGGRRHPGGDTPAR